QTNCEDIVKECRPGVNPGLSRYDKMTGLQAEGVELPQPETGNRNGQRLGNGMGLESRQNTIGN
ncbi:MAG TPA: hypothetical protein PLZ74_05905, partial [Kiritimatiellia bacterium]|nr:hypothetical protein [Kiritimatiellia bacterium]